jgi:transposase
LPDIPRLLMHASDMTPRAVRTKPSRRECGCGHWTRGIAPQGAEGPVQYGLRIAAIIVCLYTGQFLSENRTAQALAELFGIPLSPGTAAAITARAAGRLDGFLEQARDDIAASEVAGSDETRFGSRAGCTGCTAPAPASTPCSRCTPSAAPRR